MISQLVPVRFDPMTADEETWKRFHDLRRVAHEELRPDDPLRPDDVVEISMKRPDPFDFHHYYEIIRNGVAISSFGGGTPTPENPEYATNKPLSWADAYVRPEHRRKGVASLWLRVVAELMDQHGNTLFSADAHTENGHAFLKWLGAAPKLTDIESRLNLSKVDWSMAERWAREGQERSPQTRLEIYDGPLPEEMWPDYAVQRTKLLNTMPLEDYDMGDIIVTPERIRDWVARAEEQQIVWHTVVTREPDGTISGMTDVEWTPYGRRQIQQQFTGVDPVARGRGIGKWIKAAMLLHLRELYPDAEWVITDNAHSNAPMLKINRTLGFAPYRTHVSYQMPRADLEAKLEKR